jgi:hypothetical protein
LLGGIRVTIEVEENLQETILLLYFFGQRYYTKFGSSLPPNPERIGLV